MANYFEIFGIDPSFGVDREHLERRFHELQSTSHPDRHVNAESARKAQALSESSDINRAYRTLREPIVRAKYLLSLYGFSVGEQKRVPPALLMTVMEAQEKLAELGMTADRNVKQRLTHELGKLAEDLDRQREALDSEREHVERHWDTAMHPATKSELSDVEQEQLGRVAQILAERAYIETLYLSVQAAQHGRPAMIRH